MAGAGLRKGDILTVNTGDKGPTVGKAKHTIAPLYKVISIEGTVITIEPWSVKMEQFHKLIKYVVLVGFVALGGAAIYFSGLYDLVRNLF